MNRVSNEDISRAANTLAARNGGTSGGGAVMASWLEMLLSQTDTDHAATLAFVRRRVAHGLGLKKEKSE